MVFDEGNFPIETVKKQIVPERKLQIRQEQCKADGSSLGMIPQKGNVNHEVDDTEDIIVLNRSEASGKPANVEDASVDSTEQDRDAMKMELPRYPQGNRNPLMRLGVNALSRSRCDDEASIREAMKGKNAVK